MGQPSLRSGQEASLVIQLLGRLIPYRFRGLHHQLASDWGFFWLPCPLCGHEFGGHEWRETDYLSGVIADRAAGPDAVRMICPKCTLNGRGEWVGAKWV